MSKRFTEKVTRVGHGRLTQSMNIMRSLISIDDVQVRRMSSGMVLIRRRIATKNLEEDPRVLERLATIIAFHKADHLRAPLFRVLHPAQLEGGHETQSDLGRRVGELLLDQLERGERSLELFAL